MAFETTAKRRHPRLKIFRPVELAVGAEVCRAHALNISIGGALLHCADLSQAHGLIRLIIDGSTRTARIAWTNGERLGIQFMTPLNKAQIDAILSSNTPLRT